MHEVLSCKSGWQPKGEGGSSGDAWAALQARFAAVELEAEEELQGPAAWVAGGPGPTKLVYTYCGRICIAVNPYEQLPALYTVRPGAFYHACSVR